MPRYYFHIRNAGRVPDPEGRDFQGDLGCLRLEAWLEARDLMADAVKQGRDVSSRVFEIEDERGQLVLTVPFRDALTPCP